MKKFKVCTLLVFFLVGCDSSKNKDKDEKIIVDKRVCRVDKSGIDLGYAEQYEREVKKISDESDALRFVTPTRAATASDIPQFIDDIDFEWIQVAIERQLKRFDEKKYGKGMEGTIKLGDKEYPLLRVYDSLVFMQALVAETLECLEEEGRRDKCYSELDETIKNSFNIYVPKLVPGDPRYGEPKSALFTAYYTPTIKGSLKKTSETPFGIFAKPAMKRLQQKTRQEIDFKEAFKYTGLDMFYGPDLFQLYLLHVEGGGKVEYLDRKGRSAATYLSYDGTNKQPFHFISKYMKAKGYIESGSIRAQRNYLEAHPEKWEEIYSTCPSYVYFKTSDEPPEGSDSVSLTDRRSIALDSRLYNFKGMLTFVKARRPVEDWDEEAGEQCRDVPFKDFSRFFIDQDTGGAIRGKARGDLYLGESEYAMRASALLQNRGDLFFLILKDDVQ